LERTQAEEQEEEEEHHAVALREQSSGRHSTTSAVSRKRIVLAYRIVQCYVSASGQANTAHHEAKPVLDGGGGGRGNTPSATTTTTTTTTTPAAAAFYLPSGTARVADPHAHPNLLHYLETSPDYPLAKTTSLLMDHGLIGAALVACHARQNIEHGIRLLLLPSSPRIGTFEIDFLTSSLPTLTLVCTVGGGDLIRTLSFPLQHRFLCQVASSTPHLLVELMSLVLGTWWVGANTV